MADLIVAETTCDGKKKMFEMMAESRLVHLLELPRKPDEPPFTGRALSRPPPFVYALPPFWAGGTVQRRSDLAGINRFVFKAGAAMVRLFATGIAPIHRNEKLMGLTIHYRGKLNALGQLARLCDELEDIADSVGWSCQRLDEDWAVPAKARLIHTEKGATIEGHLGLKGIALIPPGPSESFSFFFNSDGILFSVMGVLSRLDGTRPPESAWVSVKTQFLSPDTHIWMLGLLRHLKKRYLSNLEVSDEGGYWETEDRHRLEERMQFLARKINALSRELEAGCLGDAAGLTAVEVADRLERWLAGGGHATKKKEPDDE